MSRRKQCDPGDVPSKRWKSEDRVVQADDAEIEWNEEEKKRLLEALKKDAGKNNWRSIVRQVRTKDITQVKLLASKLMAEKQGSSCQRPIAPKEKCPLEEWISVTEKLKGDDDVDGTCIPQIMTIAAKEPTDAASGPGCVTPNYSQIYTLLSRVMRGQPPPDLSPLDASIILDLLNDVETKVPILDASNQVNFVLNKYKEAMANFQPVTSSGCQLHPQNAKSVATTGDGQIHHTTSERPRTKLFSLNPLNIPVQLLNMKEKSSVPVNQSR